MIKQEVEKLLGVSIETFSQTFAELDAKGKLDQKIVHKLLEIILNHLEYPPSSQDAPKTPLKLEKIPVYNPDSEDCVVKVRDDKNKQIQYISHSKELEYFEPFVVGQIKTALTTQLLNKRGVKTNSEKDLKEVLEEIEVVI